MSSEALGPQFSGELKMHIASNGYVLAEHPEHGYVGEMHWNPSSGEMGNIEVKSQYQRKGVATAMWDYAREHHGPMQSRPEHSALRTPEGSAWARKVARRDKEKLPRLKRVT